MRRRFGLASTLLCAAFVAACGGMEPSAPTPDGARSDALRPPPGELPAADVAVSMIGPAAAASGISFQYLITVSNVGGQPATSVQLTDSLPLNAQFIDVTTTLGTCGRQSFDVVACTIGTLNPGATATIRITVVPVAPTSITNVAAATTTSLETNLTNNVAYATTQIILVGRGRGRGRHLGWDRH